MNKQVAALVVDDEELSRNYVTSLVRQDERFVVVGQARDGTQALADYRALQPEVMFLDLQIPGLNGFELCQQIDTASTSVVFVTAHADRALAAFDFQPVDFVTKPIRTDRFEQTLERVFNHVATRNSLQQLSTNTKSNTPARHVIHTTRGELFFDPHEIQFVESSGNYVKVWIQNQPHLVRVTFHRFCEDLDFPGIVVVHRGYAVNMEHVREMTNRSRGAELKLTDCSQIIPVSRSRREAVSKLLNSEVERHDI